MSEERFKFALAWFANDGEQFIVGEEEIYLTLDTVRGWFELPPDDNLQGCHTVTLVQKHLLAALVQVDIDLNRYHFVLEGRA